jgi:protoporphyrinogen oxidase
MRDIAVIGGGFTGLTAALRLAQKGFSVTLFEKGRSLGGLARTFPYRGHEIPCFPHQLFRGDRYLLKLLDEVHAEVHWAFSKTGVFSARRPELGILPFSTIRDLLAFPLLSLGDKMRLARLGLSFRLAALGGKGYDALGNRDARSWFIEKTGEATYATLIGPLLSNKFGIEPETVSARWMATLFKDSLRTGGVMGSVREGIHGVIERLEGLLGAGCRVVKGCEVARVTPLGDGRLEVDCRQGDGTDGRTSVFDTVLLTIPIPSVLDVVQDMPEPYLQQLRRVGYASFIGAVLLRKGQLTTRHITYFLNSEIGALNEFTNCFPEFPFTVAYIFRYLKRGSELWHLPDEEIKRRFLSSIGGACGPVDYDDFLVFREEFATPVFDVDFPSYVPPVKTPVRNLFLSGMHTFYPAMRNLDAAVRAGEEAAGIVAESLL